MLVSLLIPILVLVLGALFLLLLAILPRMPRLSIVAVGIAALALVALWQLRGQLPVGWVADFWRPLTLFGVPFAFQVDTSTWTLATALVMVSVLALVGCSASAEPPSTAVLAFILAASGAGVAALFASSFVTLVAAWGATDIILTAALLRYGKRGARRAGLALTSGVLATCALWAAPMLAQREGISGFLHLAQFSGSSASLLQMAVILRLGLVPFHLWRPIDLETHPAQLMPLVVIPTLLGFDLLTYLPALTAGLPSVLFVLAAVTLLVGGFVAWSESEERPSLAGVVVAATGLAVLAVANAGNQAVATTVAAAVAWAVGVTVFSLTPGWSGRQLWRSVPSFLALLSLIGIPSTLGFFARFTAYSGLEADLLALAVALLGETFLAAALIRLWFWADPRSLPRNRLLELVYLAIFAVAAALLFLTGLSPAAFTGRGEDTALLELAVMVRQGGVTGWTGWALPLVAGTTLFLVGEGLRQRLEGGWQGLGTMLRLEWVYGLFFITLRWVVSLMRGIAGIIEGEGALLWTAVILLIVLLYLTGGVVAPVGP